MTQVVRSRIEDSIGILTMADTHRGNTLTAELVEQAQSAHREFIDCGVRVAVLESAAAEFSLGRDAEAVRIPGVPPAGALLIDELESSPIAWVAAVNGDVAGPGTMLVSHCIHVVVGPNARFYVPELLAGIYPRPVAARLAETIGVRHAMRLLLTGEHIDAQEAVAAGLASEHAGEGEVLELALQRARALEDLKEELLATTLAAWRRSFALQ